MYKINLLKTKLYPKVLWLEIIQFHYLYKIKSLCVSNKSSYKWLPLYYYVGATFIIYCHFIPNKFKSLSENPNNWKCANTQDQIKTVNNNSNTLCL